MLIQLIEDKYWNMWFWTDNWISKFDPNVPEDQAWTTYNTSNTSTWLVSNNITVIVKDNTWNMWLGTFWWWISKYDYVSDSFINYDEDDYDLQYWNSINAAYVDNNWDIRFSVYYQNGLSTSWIWLAKYDISSNTWINYGIGERYFDPGDDGTWVSHYTNMITSITQDKWWNMRFGTAREWARKFDGNNWFIYYRSSWFGFRKISQL